MLSNQATSSFQGRTSSKFSRNAMDIVNMLIFIAIGISYRYAPFLIEVFVPAGIVNIIIWAARANLSKCCALQTEENVTSDKKT